MQTMCEIVVKYR